MLLFIVAMCGVSSMEIRRVSVCVWGGGGGGGGGRVVVPR